MIFDLYDKLDVELIRDAFKGKTVGLTSGTFDLFHATHKSYLDCCRRHCGHNGILIVGVDSDHLVRQRKGADLPIVPESDRLMLVADRKGVSAAFILGTIEDFGIAVNVLGIKYIFKNQDYIDVKVLGTDLPGVELVIVPDFHRTESTGGIIKKIISLHNKQKK